jgi:hypothetical protein
MKPTFTSPDTEWHINAACRNVALSHDDTYPKSVMIRPTRRMQLCCVTCSVRNDCLRFVMTNDSAAIWEGVWGGTTPFMRAQYRKGKTTKCKACEGTAVYWKGNAGVEYICFNCLCEWQETASDNSAKNAH